MLIILAFLKTFETEINWLEHQFRKYCESATIVLLWLIIILAYGSIIWFFIKGDK